jgi:hypothetical protein
VSTPGTLEFLCKYKFETFAPWIDESYDSIQDPVERIAAIINSMQIFADLDPNSKQHHLIKMQEVADRNKQHFFSDAFAAQLNTEYLANIQAGLRTVKESGGGVEWHQEMALYDQHPELHSEILDVRNAVEDQLHRLSLTNIK